MCLFIQPLCEEHIALALYLPRRSFFLFLCSIFLAGCEDKIWPLRLEAYSGNPEEERRLFYVAMTRAKKRLFLSYARKRLLFGRALDLEPSPFVADIEEELRRIEESRAPARKKPQARQPELF